ncbi:hypothetical protein AHAS_Ahas01G0131900 [Arachis hypogaea]
MSNSRLLMQELLMSHFIGDLAKEKAHIIAKLQDTLQAIQIQVDEANTRSVKEREIAQKAIEEAPPVIKETPVLVQDSAKIKEAPPGSFSFSLIKLATPNRKSLELDQMLR